MSRDATVVRRIRPITEPVPPLTVLFDAECPFCRWTVARLRRWDRDRNLRLRPYQETKDQPVLADLLEGHALGRAIHVVDSAGRYATGGHAVLAITSLLPGGRLVASLVAAMPASRFVLGIGYRVVDRIRPWLSAAGFNGPLIRECNPAFDLPEDV